MTGHATAIERAFELARSGDCTNLEDIRARLKAEGYTAGQIIGPSLLSQLRALCKAAQVSEA